MAYVLLTGSTGLLGRYLLRDLLLADHRVAVVVRSAAGATARQRVETAMTHWERHLQRAMPRPIVLQGDITRERLGLSADDQAWVGRHCSSVMHSAAKLTFHADSSGEPWRTNIEGTRHVLGLCRETGIRNFHHVSTAYVAGQRRGLCREDELNVGQQLGNDYEKSKLTSEQEVRDADFLHCVTVYRPSIIVGDYHTGFTTTFHGFYSPLRLVHSLVGPGMTVEEVKAVDYLGSLGLDGEERKNLVPVDWVSAVMAYVFDSPEHHGRTYNLTSPAPVTTREMLDVFEEALIEQMETSPPKKMPAFAHHDFERAFHEQMKVYQSYWRDDPQFDSTNTSTAVPHLPCPRIDRAALLRLAKYALGANFGWPREAVVRADRDLPAELQSLAGLAHAANGSARNAGAKRVGLQITGNGGGDWTLDLADGELAAVQRGLDDSQPRIYLTSAAWRDLRRGTLSGSEAIRSGRVMLFGTPPDESLMRGVVESLPSQERRPAAVAAST